MKDLSQFDRFDKIVVQCHDNPDADALASAFSVTEYFKERSKAVEIIYGGFAPVQKSNLTLMMDELGIKARFLPKNEEPPDYTLENNTLLLIVDGQYCAGNVKKLNARYVAVIDHHVPETPPVMFSDIRPFLGACSTLVWLLLKNSGFDFSKKLDVSTALYYGLYTDTGSLGEITHPLDKDMRDNLSHDKILIKRLKNCNLTMKDLMLAGKGLIASRADFNTSSGIFFAEPCDPNILGFISDLALQVDTLNSCVVFCEVSGGVKISVRSCVREIMAYELAGRLCEGGGSGGGHSEKAGGFISKDFIDKSGQSSLDFLSARYTKYFTEYDLFYSGKFKADLNEFEQYVKLKIPIGFAKTTDIFPEGTEILIRTLEGDSHIVSSENMYIMIGIRQEVYPIKREKFERTYEELQGDYVVLPEFLPERHYVPVIKNRKEGVSENIEKYIRPCVAKGETKIFARPLQKSAKVFTEWNQEGYMFGRAGDRLACRADDPSDIYIIENTIFDLTYGKI